MSEFAEYKDRLDMRERAETAWFAAELARIDRTLAENGKLRAEEEKLRSERLKYDAEALKLRRDRFLAPALALAATLGAIAALTPSIMRALGVHT